MDRKKKPILGITMGDPAGIGPEIALKAFAEKSVYQLCKPILIGNIKSLEKISEIIQSSLKFRVVSQVSEAFFRYGTVDVINIDFKDDDTDDIEFGQVSSKAGDLAFKIVVKAIELALQKEIDATVTGPIHKAALKRAGYDFAGHTEIFSHFTNTSRYAMLLAEESLRVIHVSTHVSLRQACDLVKKDRILDCVRLMHNTLIKLGINNPKIGIAGLNPHSSDNGLFGDEEINQIIPAVKEAKVEGYNVDGPVPPDTLYVLALGGKYDGCVAMYHDQGHIPFKIKGFEWDRKANNMKIVKGVNITLGLPIIRTSVDHGTAFEIAGKGIASHHALLAAIDYATKLQG